MNYPEQIEDKIGFSVIRNGIQQCCMSALGKQRVQTMCFLTDADTLKFQHSILDEMLKVLADSNYNFPQGNISDLSESISRIHIDGLFLDENEFLNISITLRYSVEIHHFFLSLDQQRFPTLCTWGIGSELQTAKTIIAAIDQIIDKYGKLKDSASPELARIRREMRLSQGAVSRALNSILSRAQAEGFVDKDATPTMREGRLVLPVSPQYKRKIGGIVHDESASGKTVFIEPTEVVEANNHIRELEGAERRERLKLLLQLTASIRPQVTSLNQIQSFLSEVDFLRAKALYARQLNALIPLGTDQPLIRWHQARHPLLWIHFQQLGKTVIPLDITLDTTNRILVISGPNAGGKSVCLKTVALLQYMWQCGLAVPLNEASTMGLFRQILIDIGDEQSLDDDLSTYSSHLRNMKHFLKVADNRTLLLIDEFGTGTEPLIGGAIAEAVLTQLNQKQAFGVITTHYTNLKHLAEQTAGIVNGAMLYDRGELRPLFQLSIGQAGSSFAIEIARQIGLEEQIIQQATTLIGSEHIDYDKQLQDIARDKRYWENKRQNIRQKEKHLEEKIAYYENEIANLKQKRKEVLLKANEQAAELLQQSNATIERTIREIKEAKAEKDATKKARMKMQTLQQKVLKTQSTEKPKEVNQKKTVLHDLSELSKIKNNPAHLITQTNTPHPKMVSSNIADAMRQKKLSFQRQLDIRGLRADEALEILIAYIDDAIMVGAEQITILHGTGTGALKQVVRDYLSEKQKAMHKSKRGEITFHDGDPNTGGAGITQVNL